jgi:hypothetical protein
MLGRQTDFKTDASTLNEVITTDMISFAQNQLKQFQPRDDCKELLNLTIIFLGGTSEKGISFTAPAGLHRARWMAKAIYSLKLYLFREQFKLTKREEKGIRENCFFAVRVYMKFWFQAASACRALRKDLQWRHGLRKHKCRCLE